jgi:hypothetical protein
MTHLRRILPLSSLALLLFLVPPSARAAVQVPAGQSATPPTQAELVLERYVVQNLDSAALYEAVMELANNAWHPSVRPTIRRLGSTIVIHGVKPQVEGVRDLLARLDVEPEREEPEARTVLEYKPRFLSMDAATKAASPYLTDYSFVAERGLIVMSGERSAIDQAKALLARIDVPEKQVLLSCQLLEVGGAPSGASAPPLARELVENLEKLLPGSSFAQVGMAMLKTSVGVVAPVSLQIQVPEARYDLACMPVAFDDASGSLTVSQCTLTEHGPEGARKLFSTSTVLRGGEYTVLAATGAAPRVLVVRVVPQP